MSAYQCPCGETHQASRPREEAELDRVIALAGDELIDVRLPDGRIYRVPRRYIAFHGIKAADVPDLARRYRWTALVEI